MDPREQIFLRGCSLEALGSPKLLCHSFQVFFSLADLPVPMLIVPEPGGLDSPSQKLALGSI